MNNKQVKKMRQVARRKANEKQSELVQGTWEMFFETMASLTFKYRFKIAWKILRGKNIYKEGKKNGTSNTGDTNNS